jgi:hypothetical protein
MEKGRPRDTTPNGTTIWLCENSFGLSLSATKTARRQNHGRKPTRLAELLLLRNVFFHRIVHPTESPKS